jgi:hypothetical protein
MNVRSAAHSEEIRQYYVLSIHRNLRNFEVLIYNFSPYTNTSEIEVVKPYHYENRIFLDLNKSVSALSLHSRANLRNPFSRLQGLMQFELGFDSAVLGIYPEDELDSFTNNVKEMRELLVELIIELSLEDEFTVYRMTPNYEISDRILFRRLDDFNKEIDRLFPIIPTRSTPHVIIGE